MGDGLRVRPLRLRQTFPKDYMARMRRSQPRTLHEENRKSGGGQQPCAQEFGREIGTVGPDQRVQCRIEADPTEHRRVPQRLEHGSVEVPGKIDFPLEPVGKPEPYQMASFTARRHDSR